MDCGFSKKREEAARIWGERLTLGDMVRAIRKFRPMVIVSDWRERRPTGTDSTNSPLPEADSLQGRGRPKTVFGAFRRRPDTVAGEKLYVSQSFTNNPSNPPTLVVNTGEYIL
ncbi:MAG: hypothetical protein IPN69_00050 [Acidobacteria bacterium]|nr:hypothetical protein [Acidobacteriota bacterium]